MTQTTKMITEALRVDRLDLDLQADPSRVLLRRYGTSGPDQTRNVISRVLALTEPEVEKLLTCILAEFADRHRDYHQALLARFEEIRPMLPGDLELSEARRAVLGASFCMEYSLECAALFNPSIVAHPDQTSVPVGGLRFVLSLRATGEGHISSITFREGAIDAAGAVTLDSGSRYVAMPKPDPEPSYDRDLFAAKLADRGLASDFLRNVFATLNDPFSLQELRAALAGESAKYRDLSGQLEQVESLCERVMAHALSNYRVSFRANQAVTEQVLFPMTPSQSNGIEDVRFVQFEDGMYYGTYTAYDGRNIQPELVATRDFVNYEFITLGGSKVRNKGMALFPRKVNGLYTMLGRQDAENLYLMQSESLHFWDESQLIVRPKFTWEMVQIGNCGSPIETEAGWLVLTHGVGPNRKYSIGVLLLDLDDPSRVIGRLDQPILSPNSEEREGYVPNVVYTCGGIVHGENLILPYAVSDSATRFARINLKVLLKTMV